MEISSLGLREFSSFWFKILRGYIKWNQRDRMLNLVDKARIETCPTFYPVSKLHPYRDSNNLNPVAESVLKRGISLLMSKGLDENDIDVIGTILESCLKSKTT